MGEVRSSLIESCGPRDRTQNRICARTRSGTWPWQGSGWPGCWAGAGGSFSARLDAPAFYLLEARGLECWLVNARDVKNVPGRPKTDKLDAVWLCKLAERGMLRPFFVPPKPIRELRDLTRLRSVFIGERSRNRQRIEKVLEDAQIKLSSVATNLFGVSGRAMLEALIGGERSPQALAGLARGRLVSKHDALVEALTGQFDEHHAYLCRLLLDTIDRITVQVDELSQRITAQLAGIRLPEADGGAGRPRGAPGGTGEADLLSLVERLDEIPGIGRTAAEVIVAELGPDMRVFPTSGHLVSWAKLAPRTIQSGGKNTSGPTGHGNPWLKGMIGEAAMAAVRTDTFLGARYRRLVKHRGHKKAIVAVARSMLVIVWHIINDPAARAGWCRRWWRRRRKRRRPLIARARRRPFSAARVWAGAATTAEVTAKSLRSSSLHFGGLVPSIGRGNVRFCDYVGQVAGGIDQLSRPAHPCTAGSGRVSKGYIRGACDSRTSHGPGERGRGSRGAEPVGAASWARTKRSFRR
ncbi:IS110 family transposase [Streptomyces sp. NPDC056352]|uniref:IS110 family transposase n=1 Tax=Streptomyces sp. NPDC056352 TaxID=3345791 RepID=UPI0035D64168